MRIILLCLALSLLVACEKKEMEKKPDPEVFAITVEEQPYTPSRGFNGRTRSASDVDIKAQISGEILAIHFKEGDELSQGDLLYEIDPAPYKAALDKAKAELSRAEANLKNAQKNYERGKQLIADGYISAAEFDNLEALANEAKAAKQSAQAALESAEVNLAYTDIKAPQDGRVGRSAVAKGDVVSPQSEALTSLVGKGGMDVVFQVPEKLLITAARGQAKASIEHIIVSLVLPDGSEYEHQGKINYISNRVDPNTGTVEAMALVPNPKDFLRPGMFVKVQLQRDTPMMGLLIPQAAVQVDQQGSYVFTVDESDTIKRKNLNTGERIGEFTLVNSGLDGGERVVVRGVQKTRPGQKVKVSEYQPATTPTAGG